MEKVNGTTEQPAGEIEKPVENGASTITTLEQKYIKLLEEKIARLEAKTQSWNNDNYDFPTEPIVGIGPGISNGDLDDNHEQPPLSANRSQANDEKESIIAGTTSEYEPKKQNRVHWIREKYDEIFGDYKWEEMERPSDVRSENLEGEDEDGPNDNDKWAITWRQKKDADGKETIRDLLIESRVLKKALKKVLRVYSNISFDTEEVLLSAPYAAIYHNTSAIRDYAAGSDEATREDINILLREVEQIQSTERKDIQNLTKEGDITYPLLWSLFYPGCLVVRRSFFGEYQVAIVAPTSPMATSPPSDPYAYNPRKTQTKVFKLALEYIDFKDDAFVAKSTDISIKEFPGTRKITDLEAFPLDYLMANKDDNSHEHPQTKAAADIGEAKEKFCQKLIARGRRFEKLCTAPTEKKFYEYSGDVISEGRVLMAADMTDDGSDAMSSFLPPPPPPPPGGRYRNSTPSSALKAEAGTYVMVDHHAYSHFGPGDLKLGDEIVNNICACTTCNELRIDIAGELPPKGSGRLMTDEQCLLCPPRVLGFWIRDKLWVQLQVDKVTEIDTRSKDEAFNSLELDKKTKDLLKTLVLQHSKNQKLVDDLIPGKGNGLIVLLHGSPGVGKTLTAESLATLSGKPLYSVTMSDIGISPTVVEKNMLRIFELATHWKALLLFDEADIFLEKRSLSDLRRNSLVSVLLRILEYFRGILFLTSNRVKTFDEAFQSRIHVAVHFRELTERQRVKIWRMWLERNEEDINDMEEFEDDLNDGDLSKAELNGRQIRNVISSAMALARSDQRKKLTLEHVRVVMQRTLDFQMYMLQNRQLAEKEGLR